MKKAEKSVLNKKTVLFTVLICALLMVVSLSVSTYSPAKAAVTEVSSFSALKNAIASAASGDTVKLGANIVIPDSETSTNVFAITKAMTIDGNGHSIRFEKPGFNADGTYNTSASAADVRMFSVSANTTFTNIVLGGRNSTLNGGILYNATAGVTVRVTDSVLEQARNNKHTGGGAVYNSSKLYFYNTLLQSNGSGYGGALYNSGTVYAENTSFINNRSLSSNGGGAAVESNGSMFINNCTFANNKSTELGSAINLMGSGHVYIMNTVFSGNINHGGSGAIRCTATNVHAVNVIFMANRQTSNTTTYTISDFTTQPTEFKNSYYQQSFSFDASLNNTRILDETTVTIGALTKLLQADGSSTGNQFYSPSLINGNLLNGKGAVGTTGYYMSVVAIKPELGTGKTAYTTYFDPDGVISYKDGSSEIVWQSGGNKKQVTKDQLGNDKGNSITLGGDSVLASGTSTVSLFAASSSGGSIAGATIYGTLYLKGASVAVTAIPNSGYSFKRWVIVSGGTTKYSGNSVYSFNIMEDTVVAAEFVQNIQKNYQYRITTDTVGFKAWDTFTDSSIYTVASRTDILSVIAAIKTDAGGRNCSINFGNGSLLNIGSSYVLFGSGWGQLTLSGKLESICSDGATLRIDGATVTSTADISNIFSGSSGSYALHLASGSLTLNSSKVSNTAANSSVIYKTGGSMYLNNGATVSSTASNCSAIYNTNGSLAINNGAVVSSSNNNSHAIRFMAGSYVDIYSGAVVSTSGNGSYAVYLAGSASVYIYNGAVVSTKGSDSHAVYNTGTGSFYITGGEISASGTNACAIYNTGSTSAISISGGTVSSSKASAVYSNATTTVSVSGSPAITSGASSYNAVHIVAGMESTATSALSIGGGRIENTAGGKAVQYDGKRTVSITGGTFIGSVAIDAPQATITLGNTPVITGKIQTATGKISAVTGSGAFNPGANKYTLDFVSYSGGAVAVTNGAAFINNFELYNRSDYALGTSGQNLVLLSRHTVSFDLNGGAGTSLSSLYNVLYGSTITASPIGTWTRDGYSHNNKWYTRTGAGTAQNPYVYTEFVFGASGTAVTSDITLYQFWVLNAPIIASYSGNISKTFNDSESSLSVTATSFDGIALSYQWYKKNAGGSYEAIGGKTAAALALKYVADSGYYKVVITATDGEQTKTAEREFSVNITKMQITVANPTFDGSLTYGDNLPEISGTTIGGAYTLDAGQTLLAGTFAYDWTFTADDTDNYEYSNTTGTISLYVAKMQITVANPTFDGSLTYGDNLPEISGATVGGAYALNAEQTLFAGTFAYDWTFTADDTDNYEYSNTTDTISLYVAKMQITVANPTFDGSLTYGDDLPEISGATIGGAYTLDAGQTLLAGTYAYAWTFTADDTDNYEYSNTTGTINLYVAKMQITVEQPTFDGSLTYGDNLPEISGATIGGAYTLDAGQTLLAGTFAYDWTFTADDTDNYEYSNTTGTISLYVAKMQITVEQPTFDGSLTYGDNLPEISGATTGGAYTLDAEQTLLAGTYAYDWTFTADDTDNYEYSNTTGTISLYVAKMQITVANPTFDGSLTYGDNLPEIRGATVGGVYTLDAGQTLLAGTFAYDWTFTADDTDNYEYSNTTGTISLYVAKMQITVEQPTFDGSLTYGDDLPEISGATTGGAYTLDAEQTLLAGTYAYDWTFTADDTDNYEYSNTTGTISLYVAKMQITVANPTFDGSLTYGDNLPEISGTTTGGAYTLDAGQTLLAGTFAYDWTFTADDTDNYEYSNTMGTISLYVAKMQITVANPTFDGSLTYGDNLPEISGTTVGGAYALNAEQTLLGGTHAYAWTFTADDTDNYEYSNTTGTIDLTVAKANQRILTINPVANKIYGFAPFALSTNGGNGNGTVVFEIISGNATVSGNTVTINGAGDIVIRATKEADGNYNQTVSAEITVIVAKKAITVTPNANQGKIFGQNEPTLTYAITNGALADGDVLSGGLTREEGEVAGKYEIFMGTVYHADYDITFVNGVKFTIQPKEVIITLQQGLGYSIIPKYGFTAPFYQGNAYSFEVTLGVPYSNSVITASVTFADGNGTVLTAIDGVYTVSDIQDDITITVSGVVMNTYAVKFNAGEGGSVSATASGISIANGESVQYGKSIVFTTSVQNGFRLKAWYINGVLADEALLWYAIPKLTDKVSVTATFEPIATQKPVVTPEKSYEVSGVILDCNGTLVGGATVIIMSGAIYYGSVLSNGEGGFVFANLTDNTYNIVAVYDNKTVTVAITVNGADEFISITIPDLNISAKVEIKEGAPNATVGGLHDIITMDNFLTEVEKQIALDGGGAELKLTLEAVNAAIIPEKGKVTGFVLNITAQNTITDKDGGVLVQYNISTLQNLISIVIPLDEIYRGKTNYVIYRIHNGEQQILTTTPNDEGEYFKLAPNGESIIIFTKNFSEYAIGFDEVIPEIAEPTTPVSPVNPLAQEASAPRKISFPWWIWLLIALCVIDLIAVASFIRYSNIKKKEIRDRYFDGNGHY